MIYKNVITVEYNNSKQEYHLFQRTDEGKKTLSRIPLQRYSVYIPVKNYKAFREKHVPFIDGVDKENRFKSYDGKHTLIQLWMNRNYMTKDRWQFRLAAAEKYSLHEADVNPIHRFLVENDVQFVPDPTYAFIDIENAAPEGPDNPSAEITAITLYHGKLNRYWTMAWHDSIKKAGKIVKGNTTLMLFPNETALLNTFIKWFRYHHPDLLTGWFSDNFDIPYIIRRLEVKEMDRFSLTPNGICWTMKKRGTGFFNKIQQEFFTADWISAIGGCDLIDYKDMYLFAMRAEHIEKPPNWKLDTIARLELSRGKNIEVGQVPWKLWREDFRTFLNYSYGDVKILVDVEKKRKLVNYLAIMRDVLKIPLRDVFFGTKITDVQMMRYYHPKKIIFPSSKKNPKPEYEGAYVKKPDPGLYKTVEGFDFASQYPTIIITYNISPETHVSKNDYRAMNPEEQSNYTVLDLDMELIFRKKPIGIVPRVVKETLETRFKFKELAKNPDKPELKSFYHNTQWGLKQWLNSIYGAMAFPTFRLFKKECAEAITYAGRALIQWVEKVIGEKYPKLKFLYCDTDGCYIAFPDDLSEEELEEHRRTLEDELNKSLKAFFEPQNIDPEEAVIRIEHDKTLRNFYILTKKRYCGINEKGKLVVKGIEVVRRNCPEGLRKELRQVFRQIIDGDFTKELLEGMWQRVQEMPLEMIGSGQNYSRAWGEYTKNLPQHVKAGTLGNRYWGQEIGYKDQPLLFYIRPVLDKLVDAELYSDKVSDVVCINDLEKPWPEWSEIDLYTFFEKWVLNKLDDFDGVPGLKEILDEFREEHIEPHQANFRLEFRKRKAEWRKKKRQLEKEEKSKEK